MPNIHVGQKAPEPRILMITERFKKLRKGELDEVFSKKNIAKVWRTIVRDQLRRSSNIYDLFDFYDFNFNIDERALLIRAEILNGDYQCSKPLIYRIEKKFGVCRHIVVPQPVDALVLQIITEKLYPEIIEKQPSPNSFYSRDKHNVRKPHEIDEYGLHWRELWKKLQKLIYQFNESKELLVVTDLTNYYDTIDISSLRKRVTQIVSDKEVLIDLLFHIIEKITWCPDYLPYSGRGLPTTNIESVRLLAHMFLFELDGILKMKTNESFARWMDDIVIGANTKEEAIEILSSASDVLKSRGLALHLVKTDIYDPKKAEFHFQIEKNQYLDTIEPILKGEKERPDNFLDEVYSAFEKHREDTSPKYWEKVTKRFITAFGRLKSNLLLPQLPILYSDFPGIRPNLLMYLSNCGFNKETAAATLSVAKNLAVFDDISLFQVCKLTTDWNIDTSKDSKKFLQQFESILFDVSMKRHEPFDFFCLLWFKAKYEHPHKLFAFISKYENIWRTSPFLRRQVTALMARVWSMNEVKAHRFLEVQISTGDSQIASIANQILIFSDVKSMESKVNMYLFPEKKSAVYQLYKFVVLCSFLNSSHIRESDDIKQKVLGYINDSYFLKWIEMQYAIS